LDLTGFFYRICTQVTALVLRTSAFTWVLMRKKKPIISKSNKTTINKHKTTHLYRSTSFRFSFIFRYFKVFQVKRIVYIYIFHGLSSVPNLHLWSVWFVISYCKCDL
jgi:hypothetical protein